MKNAKTDAAMYLLTGLIQRIEAQNPGLVDEMVQGVISDRNSISRGVADYEHIQEIFNESLKLLSRIESLKDK